MAVNIFRLLQNFELLERVAATKGIVARFVVSILQSRYFLIAGAIYLLLALILAPIAVSHYQAVRGNFAGEQLLVLPPPGPPAPAMPRAAVSAKSTAAKNVTEVAVKSAVDANAMASAKQSASTRLTVSAPTAYAQVSVPVVAPTIGAIDIKIGDNMGAKIADAEVKRLIGVREFQRGWVQSGGAGGSGPGSAVSFRHGAGKSVRAKFTIFQAKYLDGDWNCNPGALHNMMLQIRAWSKDRIDAQIVPEVLDIGTDKLFTLKPPFVYLTGHKNFRLADNEVKNLRDYLNVGGAIWADSALAGRRSRFDIAFRREMKRVLPDRDFEIVPENHEMFDIFFDNIGLPTGMNYYHEPIEMINIGGKLAVLYTLNGYGHFWEARLNKDGKIEWGRINVAERGQKPNWQHVHGPHLGYPDSAIIYRGITDESTRNIYKFGINVVVHLLTRYQRDFMFLPKELPTGPDMRNRTPSVQTTNTDETVTNAPASKEDSEAGKPGSRRGTTKRSDRNFKKP
ncbi:MAG: DUF4159 domain-containing protein [Kiritimatiellae bacterium]|nr:DUF4159 domain-containing protein [Kiritimatiellia bacterium]